MLPIKSPLKHKVYFISVHHGKWCTFKQIQQSCIKTYKQQTCHKLISTDRNFIITWISKVMKVKLHSPITKYHSYIVTKFYKWRPHTSLCSPRNATMYDMIIHPSVIKCGSNKLKACACEKSGPKYRTFMNKLQNALHKNAPIFISFNNILKWSFKLIKRMACHCLF